jgi:hypothetical protein
LYLSGLFVFAYICLLACLCFVLPPCAARRAFVFISGYARPKAFDRHAQQGERSKNAEGERSKKTKLALLRMAVKQSKGKRASIYTKQTKNSGGYYSLQPGCSQIKPSAMGYAIADGFGAYTSL